MTTEDKNTIRTGLALMFSGFAGTFCGVMFATYLIVAVVNARLERVAENYKQRMDSRPVPFLTPLTQSK